MLFFTGLGNHGPKYAGHRHNVGFMILDQLAADYNASKWIQKFHGEVAEISLANEKILLLKPHTYMNRSGRAVSAAMQFYKLSPEQLTVFHDDLDLPVAKLRIKTGGGHGGHNGLRDIDAHIGKNYRRVRIGIDHPGHKDEVSDYVLHNFSKNEQQAIDMLLEDISRYADLIVAEDDAGLMNKCS
jgi:PTH1 family peptidyl-tRNA hydrolase